jgi:hypothetical protein
MADVVSIVGGVEYLLGDSAHVGDLQWSTAWPYGCYEASWSMSLPPNTFPRALTTHAHIEIWDGPIRVWAGFLKEPQPGDRWTCHAVGWYAAFARLLALNTAGTAPTAIPAEAVQSAITRASLPVIYSGGLSATTISSADETVAANYALPLIDAATVAAGQRWKIDENYLFTAAADPTAHTLVLASANALRGTADDDYVTDVYPRFVSSLDGTTGEPDGWGLGHVSSPSTPAGRSERVMDVTDLGQMSEPDAETIAQGQLDLNRARLGYTSPLEVAHGELLRPGGSPARLGLVKAGEMVRGFSVADASGAVQIGLTQDVVIGRTVYTDGARTLPLTPVGLAPRTFVDSMKAMKPKDSFDGHAA